jgi:agmatine deiminase
VCEQWGDTTDSHIDLIARFTPQSTILYSSSDDPSDPRYQMHKTHLAELKQQVDRLGLDYQLIPLPEPEGGVYQVSGEIDWRDSLLSDASYTNYYIANNLVLVPVFGNKNDQDALAILREHFPDREVIGLDCVAITEHGGAIHCVTQQQPAVIKGAGND